MGKMNFHVNSVILSGNIFYAKFESSGNTTAESNFAGGTV